MLLCITYDHTHLKVDMHPAKTIHPEIIILVRIFECRIQILRAFLVTTISGDTGSDYHHLTSDLIETTFRDHSPQDQVVETPTSKSADASVRRAGAARACGSERGDEFGDGDEEVLDEAVVGDAEDRRLLVLVDRDDDLANALQSNMTSFEFQDDFPAIMKGCISI